MAKYKLVIRSGIPGAIEKYDAGMENTARAKFAAKGASNFQKLAYNSGYPPFYITIFEVPDSISLEELQSVQLREDVITQVQRVAR